MQSESMVMQVKTVMKKLLRREIKPTGENYCDNVRKDQNAGRFRTRVTCASATYSVQIEEQSLCSAQQRVT